MFRYAQIDSDGFIVSDSQLSGEVIADDMIRVGEDVDLTNKKYNLDTKEFEEYIPEVIEPVEEPSINEEILLETKYQTLLLEMGGM